MKRCGKCNLLASDVQRFCPKDGTILEPDPLATELQETLGEKYTLTYLIGQGSMGAVYRARHRDLDDVAIKVMLGQKNNAQLSARFLREAQALRRLRHPNSVMVYDLERSPNGVSYMVMEFIEGTSLRQELERRKPFPLEEAIVIAEAVCDALREAHEHGIIHRDIKPDNILIAEENLSSGRTQRRIKVVDFGVVKLPTTPEGDLARPITRAGTPIGTPYYMSPEQWFGEGPGLYGLDGRADIYALGCTMYEILSGRVPFRAETTKEMRRLHLQAVPTPLQEIMPAVPRLVSDVIMRALEKDRDLRQRTAADFAADLRAAYRESFRETEQLSAERLAAAKEAWGRSDAPLNERQMAPTSTALPSAKELVPRREELVSTDASLLELEGIEESKDKSAPPANEEVEPAPVPADSGSYPSLSDLADSMSPTVQMEIPRTGDNVKESSVAVEPTPTDADAPASAWAATADPDPPAPGDTYVTNIAKQTVQLGKSDTVQLRLRDVTVPPQPPPVLPPSLPLPVVPPSLPPTPLPEEAKEVLAETERIPTLAENEIATHRLLMPERSVVFSPPAPLPKAEPTESSEKSRLPDKPSPPARWPKVAAGIGVFFAGLAVAGGLLYHFWPSKVKPQPPAAPTPIQRSDIGGLVPGALKISAPPDSVVFLDDEQVATVSGEGQVTVPAAPGVRNVRVAPPQGGKLRMFIQDTNLQSNQMIDVAVSFASLPLPLAGLDATMRRQRAEKYAAQGDLTTAEVEYRQLLSANSDDRTARRGLAQLLSRQKRYGEALTEWETLSHALYRSPDVLRELARHYALKRRDTDAERTLLQALHTAPRNSALHAELARVLTRQPDRLEDALKEADLALQSRKSSEYLDTKARVLIERGAPQDAVPLAEQAAKREPSKLEWQATWAVALQRAQQPDAAQEKYRQLRQKDKKGEWLDAQAQAMQRGYGKNFREGLEALISHS